jgi:hypothetical protein
VDVAMTLASVIRLWLRSQLTQPDGCHKVATDQLLLGGGCHGVS